MERKNIVTSILLIALITSGIGNIVLIIEMSSLPIVEPPDFIIGTSSGHHTLELVDSWDKASNDVLYQVVETLFSYDLTDLDLPRINLLAHSYWWKNSTILQIQLRKGILFHDGTSFNADAAKWNLDRLQYLINATGTNYGVVAHTQSLWMFPDGETPIMDTITAISDNNITITLNGAYGPFLNTLAYINAGMISPTAHASHATSFIPLTTGDVIGTGPFMYDYFTPNEGVYLSRWEGYWKNLANFKRIKFAIIPDSADRNNAMLDKSVDLLIGIDPSFLPSFESDSSITVKRFTDDTEIPGLTYQYLILNRNNLNETWRKVLSYGINYTYIINEMKNGLVVRANSPISPAFGVGFNDSVKAADYNITKAREIIVSMRLGNLSWTDIQWENIAENSPFLSIEFFHYINPFLNEIYSVFFTWMRSLGIDIVGHAWFPEHPPYWGRDYPAYDCTWLRCDPDYFEPYNMLYQLFHHLSEKNYYQYNDTWLKTKMELALQTTNDDARTHIYKDIQWYLSEKLYPHAFGFHPKVFSVHSANLYGVPYNALERFEAYGIRRA